MPIDDDLTQETVTDEDGSEFILNEAAGPATIDLKIIKPGWGSSGFYPADVLKEDGPRAWPAGTHMYLDHPTASEAKERPERSIKDLAAVTISDPVYQEDGARGPGLYAKATVLPQYKETIKALAPHIGVSIRAHGSFKEGEAEGRTGRVITKISKGESIDFVTKPGAGGQVLAIMESLREQSAAPLQNEAPRVPTSTSMNAQAVNSNYVQEVGTSATPSFTITTTGTNGGGIYTPTVVLPPVSEAQSKEDTNMELTEAQERITALEADLKEANDKVIEESTRADRAEGALAIHNAEREARKLMENISLPAAAKQRVITKVSADPPMKEGKLDAEAIANAVEAAAKVEAEYLESLGVIGKVTDQGTASGDGPADAEVKESLAVGLGSFFNLDADAAKRAANGR